MNGINNKLRERICIVVPHLKGGGIERCRLNLAQEFIARGMDVDLVVGHLVGELADSVPDGVNLYEIAKISRLFFMPGLMSYLAKRRPAYIISAFDDVNCIILISAKLLRLPAKILVGNDNSLSNVISRSKGIEWVKYALLLRIMRISYKYADVVVAVSSGVANELSSLLEISNIEVIYNPVVVTREVPNVRKKGNELREIVASRTIEHHIAFVGRLSRQKRVDILIEAFSLVAKSYSVHLCIVGDGELRNELELLVKKLGLEKSVSFLGFISEPQRVLVNCDLLVLSSDYEGFGNVIVEAMQCGTQVVSTDCPWGPAEILEDGRWGQLVQTGDVVGLGNAIVGSITKKFWIEPSLLRKRASMFSVEHVANRYLSVLLP